MMLCQEIPTFRKNQKSEQWPLTESIDGKCEEWHI